MGAHDHPQPSSSTFALSKRPSACAMAHRDHLTELLDDIFHSPPVYNGIFSCLSPPDIIRVGWTCRLLREAVADFQRLAYNINRHLTHFVQEPIALRHLQRKTGFLISGSNALQFLDRTFYSSSDLDLFAYPESAKAIGAHLIEKEGYVFKPSAKQPKMFEELVVTPRNMDVRFRGPSLNELAYSANGMSELFRFTHSERNLEVQLITCQRAPLDCVLYFHSSQSCHLNSLPSSTDRGLGLVFSLCHEYHHCRYSLCLLSQSHF